MNKDEAIHKALKVLNCLNNDRVYETAWVKGAINACEEALEQPAQSEYMVNEGGTGTVLRKPAPSWQRLTDDVVASIWMHEAVPMNGQDFKRVYRAIEQALKEKNHG
jgi:hypothetical protein